MIPVTKSFIPPIDKYTDRLKEVWESGWLTNRGKLVLSLEEKLKDYLQISNILLTTNGTLPIQIALKVLAANNGVQEGEVITTPFSYVATTSAIVWEGLKPVFVDINPDYLSIDECQIEKAITDKTIAILCTHVFGNPCNVEALELISKKYSIPIIYDAAHAFGVRIKEKSIFEYGDISTCSFHATKLFHTGEGGALITSDKNLAHKLFYSHNFGHNGPLDFHGIGINAKMSELQAAMGHAVLPYMETILEHRKQVVKTYNNSLDFERIRNMKIRSNTLWNYSYYPIIFDNESDLLKVEKALNNKDVFPRRYFYPSLNTLDYITYQKMPVSEKIASTVMCLPLYHGLDLEDVRMISSVINDTV